LAVYNYSGGNGIKRFHKYKKGVTENMRILLSTIQSHKTVSGDIERGIGLYQNGEIQFTETESGEYTALVPQKNGETRKVTVRFSKDKLDVIYNRCYCTRRYKDPPLCRHVIAAIFAIQGGIIDSPFVLGKTGTATVITNESNVAETVESGSLPVFATPSMIALMEKASCNCIEDCLEKNETSVGTSISVEHTAASKIGTIITAKSKIEAVLGRKIEFSVIAYGNEKKIGEGTHNRIIVDSKRFMERLD
jgi:predicted thioesterase